MPLNFTPEQKEAARVTNGPFSEREFLNEICEFRRLFGDKTFWAKPEHIRKRAIDGINYMYFRLEVSKPVLEKMAGLLTSTLDEYTRRETLLIIHGLMPS